MTTATLPCPVHFRPTFLDEPRYVELSRGEHLYKFVSMPIQRHRILLSPWWIRQPVFDDLQRRARRLQKPMRDLVRSQLAITEEWNPGMDTVFIVVLSANVGAWEGRARTQSVARRNSGPAFIGGGRQLCVPGLTWQQIGPQYSGTLER